MKEPHGLSRIWAKSAYFVTRYSPTTPLIGLTWSPTRRKILSNATNMTKPSLKTVSRHPQENCSSDAERHPFAPSAPRRLARRVTWCHAWTVFVTKSGITPPIANWHPRANQVGGVMSGGLIPQNLVLLIRPNNVASTGEMFFTPYTFIFLVSILLFTVVNFLVGCYFIIV